MAPPGTPCGHLGPAHRVPGDALVVHMSAAANALISSSSLSEQTTLALRPRDAARALGISERLLFDLTKSGVVPHVRLGRKLIVYPIDSLRAWLAAQVQPSVTAATSSSDATVASDPYPDTAAVSDPSPAQQGEAMK